MAARVLLGCRSVGRREQTRQIQLIGSMSPWVLPERTLGTVRYTETYPGNYLICRTVPSLLQTVPSFEPPKHAFPIIAIFAKGLRAYQCI